MELYDKMMFKNPKGSFPRLPFSWNRIYESETKT